MAIEGLRIVRGDDLMGGIDSKGFDGLFGLSGRSVEKGIVRG